MSCMVALPPFDKQPCGISTVSIRIAQMRTLRHREVKKLAPAPQPVRGASPPYFIK